MESTRTRIVLLIALLSVAVVAFDLYRAAQCHAAECTSYNYFTFKCQIFDCIK